jgi:biopolymer transport protein ExbB
MTARLLQWLPLALVVFVLLGVVGVCSAQDIVPAAGSGGEHAAAPAGHSMDFITVITRAGWFGALIWLMLFGALGVCIWLIVDSYITIQELRVMPAVLISEVNTALAEGDIVKAVDRCTANPCPLANVLQAGLENVEEGFEVVQDMIGVAADTESERMLQRVTYLSVVSNTTPMLGLIGTVQGMIYAFFSMGTMEAGAAQQSMLAINISHGLWATAVGLGISVPAAIYFYFFKNKAMRLILRMEAVTISLVKGLRNVEVVTE